MSKLSMKCDVCGWASDVVGDDDALSLLRRLETAHDALRPDCSHKYVTPASSGLLEGTGQ